MKRICLGLLVPFILFFLLTTTAVQAKTLSPSECRVTGLLVQDSTFTNVNGSSSGGTITHSVPTGNTYVVRVNMEGSSCPGAIVVNIENPVGQTISMSCDTTAASCNKQGGIFQGEFTASPAYNGKQASLTVKNPSLDTIPLQLGDGSTQVTLSFSDVNVSCNKPINTDAFNTNRLSCPANCSVAHTNDVLPNKTVCITQNTKTSFDACVKNNNNPLSLLDQACVSGATKRPASGCTFPFFSFPSDVAASCNFSGGEFRCSESGTMYCQQVPKPTLRIPLLELQGGNDFDITEETDVTMSVSGCVLPGDVKLLVDGTAVGSSKKADKGKTISFTRNFSEGAGSHRVSATCNNGATSNTVTINITDQPFSVRAVPADGDSAFYVGHPLTLTVQGCTGSALTEVQLTDNKDQEDVGGIPDNQAWEEGKKYTYTKPGTYQVIATCGHRQSRNGSFISDAVTTISFEVTDPASIQPDELTEGACEICHPDWPVYEGQMPSGERCRGGEPGSDNYKYFLKPIKTVTCVDQYVCDHLVGCVVPTGGLTPPAQLCQDSNNASQTCDTALGPISTTAGGFITSILGILLSISGMIAVYLIVRSGYQLMTSRGNPEAIQEAKERLTSAIIGLLLIIFSLVIMSVIGVDLLNLPGFGS